MWTPDPTQIITAEQKAAEAQAALQEQFRAAIQAHVDATAMSKLYNDSVTLASYDTLSQPNAAWKAEAAAFVIWRTAVWEYVNGQLLLFGAGEREIPTIEDFIAELPVIVWPQ